MKALAKWLNLDLWNPEIERMAQACWQWSKSIDDGNHPRWLSLVGKSGTGKTHCARNLWATHKRAMDWGCAQYLPHVVKWARFADENLRAGELGEYWDMMRWPLLVLDDVGSERDSTGFVTDKLVTLLDARERKWTIITSNLTLPQLAAIDARISSRMLRNGSEVVTLTCEDYSAKQARDRINERLYRNK